MLRCYDYRPLASGGGGGGGRGCNAHADLGLLTLSPAPASKEQRLAAGLLVYDVERLAWEEAEAELSPDELTVISAISQNGLLPRSITAQSFLRSHAISHPRSSSPASSSPSFPMESSPPSSTASRRRRRTPRASRCPSSLAPIPAPRRDHLISPSHDLASSRLISPHLVTSRIFTTGAAALRGPRRRGRLRDVCARAALSPAAVAALRSGRGARLLNAL